MTKTLSISEAAVAYGTAVADLQQPLILQQQGQPLAVMVSFEEYQHWRALEADEAQRRSAGWRSLEELLTELHRRPSDYTAEQIEAEIGAARAEVRKARDDRRRGH
jgi:PHD/YefM family antitoxin component YafN of YafNO toxin-antitoxin module